MKEGKRKTPPAAEKAARGELLTGIGQEIRQATALGVMFGQLVANRVGIASADLEALDLIAAAEKVTAGELAAATGLTSGAVTGMIDRLERAGLARRERDAEDRRRVYVRVVPEGLRTVEPYYQSLARSMGKILADYSDEELRLLLGFFQRSRSVITGEIEKLSGRKT